MAVCERILVLLFGDLGDTLLTVPALRAIRRRYPRARLVALTKDLPAQILRDLELVDDVIVVDKHAFDAPLALLNPRAWLALIRVGLKLRREQVDSVAIFHHLVSRWGTLKFALLALAAGACERVGIDNGRGWFLTRRVEDCGFGARHEAEYMMEVAGLLDAQGNLDLEAPVRDADRLAANRLLAQAPSSGAGLLAIHPGTGAYGPGRRWEPARFAEAAAIVMDRRGLGAVIVGTDTDSSAASEVAERLGGHVLNLVGKTSVGELGAVLERCRVLLANDGGVAHLSAAVGTPVVTVFGPSNEAAWRPLLGTVVAAELACRPCFYRDVSTGLRDGCATRECLRLVTPGDVAAAALDLLSGRRIAV